MSEPSLSVEELVVQLHALSAICLDGPYTLKSGIQSPFYIDLRRIVSFPKVLQAVSEHLYHLVRSQSFDVVCGVPYTALPMATLLSVTHNVPMLMRRKEAKSYGLKKCIEGVWQQGQRCLVVEDLVTTGLSVFETIEPLTAAGLKVEDVVVLINREQGGRENIEARGLRLHALVTITEVMDILERKGKIGKEVVEQVKSFVRNSKMEIKNPVLAALSDTPASPPPPPAARLSYSDRIGQASNAAARSLLALMDRKRSNLCLSADVTSKAVLLRLADEVGPHICLLKTHVDILEDFDAAVVPELQRLGKKHGFMLFEDRKFADIGSTVAHQYSGGLYRIADWSHVTNCHVIPGPGVIAGLEQAAKAAVAKQQQGAGAAASDPADSARGLLLIAEMSSAGSLAVGGYTDANVAWAEQHAHFVMGFICQRKLSQQPGMIHMSPGVQLPPPGASAPSASASGPSGAPGAAIAAASTGGDSLGQQYHSPAAIVGAQGSDVIIVGRAIIGAKDPVEEAKRYQQEGWKAYEDSLRVEQ